MKLSDYFWLYLDLFIPTYLALVAAGITLHWLNKIFVSPSVPKRTVRGAQIVELPEPINIQHEPKPEDPDETDRGFDPTRFNVK